MSVSPVSERGQQGAAPTVRYDDPERGSGWVMFAGTMLCLVGTLNMIQGIAAIDNAHIFTHNATYIAGDLNAWGWTTLIVGACEILAGLGVYARNQFARWTGVLVASLNCIAQLMFVPAYPIWSLTLFGLDILVIYGLVAYGGRMTEPDPV